jgi:peptidyl-dipeptidase A
VGTGQADVRAAALLRRGKLDKTYGKDKAEVGNGLIAAHLLGNMWQQDWSNLWDQLEPYPGAGSLDITAALESSTRPA